MPEPVPGRDIPGAIEPESRFCGPTDLCPDPGRWHSTDGDSTELEVSALIEGLVMGLRPRCIIETGAGFGQTTEKIMNAIWPIGGHDEIDMFKDQESRFISFENDPERFAGLADRIAVRWPDGYARECGHDEIDSAAACSFVLAPYAAVEFDEWASVGWPDQIIDFAFFDSFYECRVPEFWHFRPWMRRGTIVAFHDTAPGHGRPRLRETGTIFPEWNAPDPPDLHEAIEWELVRSGQIRLIRLPTPRGITIGEVL